jgi:hypothetical protein
MTDTVRLALKAVAVNPELSLTDGWFGQREIGEECIASDEEQECEQMFTQDVDMGMAGVDDTEMAGRSIRFRRAAY